MDTQIKNLLESIHHLNGYTSKLERYVKYLQDYIQGISSEDYDPEDYLSFDEWLVNN